MSDLSRYRQKRNPATTTEPFSAEHSARESKAEEGTRAGRFVIHQHAARRMHYDLRLPIGGVLSSFAVPQGPSLDPTVKRLAVRTEDHPKEYLDFEDTIAEGNYGAGAMIVWDSGGVVYNETTAEEGVLRGKIDFTLSGFKVSGRFALIATGRRKAATGLAGTSKAVAEWLLIKKPDSAARQDSDVCGEFPRSVLSGMTVAELPRKTELGQELVDFARTLGGRSKPRAVEPFAPPMLCEAADGPKAGVGWLYELKLDGVRILAEKSGDQGKLTYRSGRITTRSYPEVVRALRSLPVDHVVLDGEIVTFDERGRPSFDRLRPRMVSHKPRDVERVSQQVPVVYLVFDILEIGSEGDTVDLRDLPLEKRNLVRAKLLHGMGSVRNLDHIQARGDALWQLVEGEGLEGMVAKRRTSLYHHGPGRTGDWIKIKRARDQEFVVVGWTTGSKNEQDLGALLLASYQDGQLCYRGRVGSGFSHLARKELLSALESIEIPTRVLDVPEEVALARFCTPTLVARVQYQGFSDAGHLRAAVFLGLRDDVRPEDCEAGPHEEPSSSAPEEAEAARAPTATTSLVPRSDLVLSNLGKVFWPDEGTTKGDLIQYYERVSGVMLPHLAGRPVVLVRYPDGILGKSFYQWRLPEGAPAFMRSQELWDEDKQQRRGGSKAAFLVDSTEALLYVINLGCIPLHVLASREHSPHACDFVTIDFDLGERPISDAVRLALSLKEVLDDLSLRGYAKTSGQRGLHVLIPLGPGIAFESAKILGELLGRLIVARHPDVCTMERMRDKRGDKLYVDTGQVGQSRTIVAPYSVRAHPGATVSTPLRWEELHLALDPSLFDIRSVPDRVAQLGDPMADLLDQTPPLKTTLAKLAAWTGR